MDRSLFSHKTNHGGYRFQVATAFGTSTIVHISGGVPCGANPDLSMVRQALLPLLEPGERIAADEGYPGEFQIIVKLPATCAANCRHNWRLKQMGARHETVNKRLKEFRILSSGMFRGNHDSLAEVFQAVAQIVQVKLRREPLYDIKERFGL